MTGDGGLVTDRRWLHASRVYPVSYFCSLLWLSSIRGMATPWTYLISPFISVLCHSDWHFYGESCPRLDVIHSGRAWSSSPACTWHCSRQLPCFIMICYYSILSFLALTVSTCNSFLFTPTLLLIRSFSLLPTKLAEFHSVLSSQRRQDVFLHSFWESSFHSCTLLQATLALSLVVSSLKSVCCDSHIFCSDAPIAYPLFNLVRNSVLYSSSSVTMDLKTGLKGNFSIW